MQYLIEKRNIEIVPLAYMRGRTLNDACIILDEAQNATISQIKMFLTRLGENSKMIITGDETQIDLNNRTFSGLKKTRKNYEFLADAYFLSKEKVQGIDALIKAESIESDANLSYKIARFAFENEDWSKSINYFKQAKDQGYDKYPGRLELLLGISYFEISQYQQALVYLNESLEIDQSTSAAEGWINYINDILGTQNT